MGEAEGVEAGGDVVCHDAEAVGEAFEGADGPGLKDVEEAEEREGEKSVEDGGAHGDESGELACELVEDDELGVFDVGVAGDAGADAYADVGEYEHGDEGGDGERVVEERAGGGEPAEDGGDGGVGAGARAEESDAEDGGEEAGGVGAIGAGH